MIRKRNDGHELRGGRGMEGAVVASLAIATGRVAAEAGMNKAETSEIVESGFALHDVLRARPS